MNTKSKENLMNKRAGLPERLPELQIGVEKLVKFLQQRLDVLTSNEKMFGTMSTASTTSELVDAMPLDDLKRKALYDCLSCSQACMFVLRRGKQVRDWLKLNVSHDYGLAFDEHVERLWRKIADADQPIGSSFADATHKALGEALDFESHLIELVENLPDYFAKAKHGSIETNGSFAGFAPADTLVLDHGCVRTRLSEGKKEGKIRSKPASPGWKDSQGKCVKTLYNTEDAKKYGIPKKDRSIGG